MAGPAQLTPEQVSAIASAGAGPLCDLAKQAGAAFALDAVTAKDHGAGFVSDLLRMSYVPPAPFTPYSAAIQNVANANPANIKVSPEDFPNFPVGTLVTFSGTGMPSLDAAPAPVAVTFNNTVGYTFKVDIDASGEAAPGSTGTVTTAEPPPAQQASIKTILDNPPPVPVKLDPQVPNGYEQAKEAGNAV